MHDVVGNINDVIFRGQADGRKAISQPLGAFLYGNVGKVGAIVGRTTIIFHGKGDRIGGV